VIYSEDDLELIFEKCPEEIRIELAKLNYYSSFNLEMSLSILEDDLEIEACSLKLKHIENHLSPSESAQNIFEQLKQTINQT